VGDHTPGHGFAEIEDAVDAAKEYGSQARHAVQLESRAADS